MHWAFTLASILIILKAASGLTTNGSQRRDKAIPKPKSVPVLSCHVTLRHSTQDCQIGGKAVILASAGEMLAVTRDECQHMYRNFKYTYKGKEVYFEVNRTTMAYVKGEYCRVEYPIGRIEVDHIMLTVEDYYAKVNYEADPIITIREGMECKYSQGECRGSIGQNVFWVVPEAFRPKAATWARPTVRVRTPPPVPETTTARMPQTSTETPAWKRWPTPTPRRTISTTPAWIKWPIQTPQRTTPSTMTTPEGWRVILSNKITFPTRPTERAWQEPTPFPTMPGRNGWPIPTTVRIRTTRPWTRIHTNF